MIFCIVSSGIGSYWAMTSLPFVWTSLESWGHCIAIHEEDGYRLTVALITAKASSDRGLQWTRAVSNTSVPTVARPHVTNLQEAHRGGWPACDAK